MKNLKKTLGAIVLGTATALSGCGRSNSIYDKSSQLSSQEEVTRRGCDYLADQINQIAVYTIFNGRVMLYKDFTESTGIERNLSQEFYERPVWVVVVPNGRGVKQEVIKTDSSSSEGYIRFDISESEARDALAKLSKKRDELLGIKRMELTPEDLKYYK